MGRTLHVAPDAIQARPGQRMRAQVRILQRTAERLLRHQPFHQLGQAARRYPHPVQRRQRERVGLGFHAARIPVERAADDGTAEARHGARGLTVAGSDAGARRKDEGDDLLDLGLAERAAQLGQVPADDMAGLVGQDADDHAGVLGLQQQAGIDENMPPARDESVELLVVDDMDANIGAGDADRPENRCAVGADGAFDLGIPDQRQAPRRGGGRKRRAGNEGQQDCKGADHRVGRRSRALSRKMRSRRVRKARGRIPVCCLAQEAWPQCLKSPIAAEFRHSSSWM